MAIFFCLKFRSMKKRKKRSGKNYSLDECGEEINLGKRAVENFRIAEEQISNQRSRHYSHSIPRYDDDEDKVRGKELNIIHPIVSEVETNMLVTDLILESSNFSETKDRQRALEYLYSTNDEISSFFRHISSYPWEDHIKFVSELFTRSHACLTILTTKLSYLISSHDEEVFDWYDRIRKLIPNFNKSFPDHTELPWLKYVGCLKQKRAKVEYMRRLFRLNIMHSFSWLTIDDCLPQHQNKILEFVKIMRSGKDLEEFNKDDKVVYVSMYFAMVYKHYDNIRLDEQMVVQFLKDLIRNGCDISEPYLFHLMLIWPTKSDTDYEEQDIKTCLERLDELKSQHLDSNKSGGYKLPILFFIGNEKGVSKLLPFQSKNAAQRRKEIKEKARRFTGTLDGDKNVEIQLQSGSVIKVRVADLRFRAQNKVENVIN